MAHQPEALRFHLHVSKGAEGFKQPCGFLGRFPKCHCDSSRWKSATLFGTSARQVCDTTKFQRGEIRPWDCGSKPLRRCPGNETARVLSRLRQLGPKKVRNKKLPPRLFPSRRHLNREAYKGNFG